MNDGKLGVYTVGLEMGDVIRVTKVTPGSRAEVILDKPMMFFVTREHLESGWMDLPLDAFEEGASYRLMVERPEGGVRSPWAEFEFRAAPEVSEIPVPQIVDTEAPRLTFSSPEPKPPIRVNVTNETGKPKTCQVWLEDRLVFEGQDYTAAMIEPVTVDKLGDLLAGHDAYHVNDEGWTVCICGHVAEGDDEDGSHARHVAQVLLSTAFAKAGAAEAYSLGQLAGLDDAERNDGTLTPNPYER